MNFQKLSEGRLDYIVTSYSNGPESAKQMGAVGRIKALPQPITTKDDLYIIFSKKTVTPGCVGKFSDALKNFRQTERYDTIYRKYFSPYRSLVPAVPKHPEVLR